MAHSTREMVRMSWARIYRQLGGCRAPLSIPVETGADPARLEPGTRSYQALGRIGLVVLRGEDAGGYAPLGLAPGTLRALTLAAVPIGARLELPEGVYTVTNTTAIGPGALMYRLECRRVADLTGGAP